MAQVLIIYGSTGGNTEFTVERAADLLEESGHDVVIMRVERYTYADLMDAIRKADFLVLASPTYGHGQLQEDMIPFVKQLKDEDLTGQPYAVIGLGDPKYDDHYHIESTFILEELLDSCGAKKMHYALRISRSPMLQVNNLIPKWAEKFAEKIEKYNQV